MVCPSVLNHIRTLGFVKGGTNISALDDLRRKIPTVLGKIRRVAGALNRLTPAMVREAKLYAEQEVRRSGLPGQLIKKRFDKQATSGINWAALKPATIKARLRKGYGRGPKLVNTGALERDAIANANDSFTIDLRYKLNATNIAVAYAEFIQHGTPKMAARPFFAPFDEKEIAILMKAAAKYLLEYFMKKAVIA